MAHGIGPMQELHLGQVLDTQDPEGRGRIQVRLHATGLELWAACIVGSAGHGYGISLLPRVDEIVVIAFVSPELPLVLGAVWAGNSAHPGDAQAVDDKYAMVTPAGTKVLIDDAQGPQVSIQTPAGNHLTITDEGSGQVTIEKGAEVIEMTASGITLRTSGNVEVNATQVNVSASMVQVQSGFSQFSGVVQCDTLITNAVVSTSYTPGAGNIW